MPRIFKDLGTEDSPEYLTLTSLVRLGGNSTHSEITGIVSSMDRYYPSGLVQTGLRRLMEKGLVAKIDSRPSSYFITESGWDLLEEIGLSERNG